MKMTEMQDRRFGWVFRRTWGQDFRRTCGWTLGLVAVFVFLGCFTDVEGQSLGDVARKSRKEKKKKKTPSGSRVFTNEEISTLPPLTSTSTTSSTGQIQGIPVPAATVATAAKPQVAGVSNKPDTDSEEYWRNRFGLV